MHVYRYESSQMVHPRSFIGVFAVHIPQARTQSFEKGGENFRHFTKGGGRANLKKIPISSLNLGV